MHTNQYVPSNYLFFYNHLVMQQLLEHIQSGGIIVQTPIDEEQRAGSRLSGTVASK